MKKLRSYYIISAIIVIASSCRKDHIMLYEGDNYVQFTKSYKDSSLFSFLALPNDNQATTPLAIELIGKPENRDRVYKLAVVKEATTAPEANYSIPATFTLRANRTVDTAWITVKKTPEIATKPVRLVLKIDASEDFRVGQLDRSLSILYISNVIARPDWWDDTVEGRFLGDYSDKKYKLFIQVTGKSDIDASNLDEVRYYTIIFKNYLLREKDAGRTVYEDNGMEMTVALIGG